MHASVTLASSVARVATLHRLNKLDGSNGIVGVLQRKAPERNVTLGRASLLVHQGTTVHRLDTNDVALSRHGEAVELDASGEVEQQVVRGTGVEDTHRAGTFLDRRGKVGNFHVVSVKVRRHAVGRRRAAEAGKDRKHRALRAAVGDGLLRMAIVRVELDRVNVKREFSDLTVLHRKDGFLNGVFGDTRDGQAGREGGRVKAGTGVVGVSHVKLTGDRARDGVERHLDEGVVDAERLEVVGADSVSKHNLVGVHLGATLRDCLVRLTVEAKVDLLVAALGSGAVVCILVPALELKLADHGAQQVLVLGGCQLVDGTSVGARVGVKETFKAVGLTTGQLHQVLLVHRSLFGRKALLLELEAEKGHTVKVALRLGRLTTSIVRRPKVVGRLGTRKVQTHTKVGLRVPRARLKRALLVEVADEERAIVTVQRLKEIVGRLRNGKGEGEGQLVVRRVVQEIPRAQASGNLKGVRSGVAEVSDVVQVLAVELGHLRRAEGHAERLVSVVEGGAFPEAELGGSRR
mmetsp:Transcript_1438/g.4552  ORF Transcript_1438/g.4552 Transcript_1438/m.4552 type:complete len:519 (+) Transcript_1438:109-1665(+)